MKLVSLALPKSAMNSCRLERLLLSFERCCLFSHLLLFQLLENCLGGWLDLFETFWGLYFCSRGGIKETPVS